MQTGWISVRRTCASLALAGVFATCGMATADELDDGEDLPATSEEVEFIHAIVAAANEATPELEGWHREVRVTAGGNTVRDGKPILVFSRSRDYPLLVGVRVAYREITDADRQQAATEKTAEQLQREMMEAGMAGDMAKVQQLQQELAEVVQASMAAGAMGQAAGVTPIEAREDPREFQVSIIVNGDGESIGKEYDFDVPGVTKAFRSTKGNADVMSYKYYLGPWEVSELNARNWSVTDPDDAQTAENHLRAIVAMVSVFGDPPGVEDYVDNHLQLPVLNRMVD